jgi:hypothetical protein
LHAFLISPMRTTCRFHIFHFHLVIPAMLRKEYRLWSFSSYHFLFHRSKYSPLHSSSLRVRDQVLRAYKIGKIT